VRSAIERIVADVDAAFDTDEFWPTDDWDGWQAALPMKNLYVGAAGVIHVLDVLRTRGIVETQIDLASAQHRTTSPARSSLRLRRRGS
jgi:hypothetical protein